MGEQVLILFELSQDDFSVIFLDLSLFKPEDLLRLKDRFPELPLESPFLKILLVAELERLAQGERLLQVCNALLYELGVVMVRSLTELDRSLSLPHECFKIRGAQLDRSLAVLVHKLKGLMLLERCRSVG